MGNFCEFDVPMGRRPSITMPEELRLEVPFFGFQYPEGWKAFRYWKAVLMTFEGPEETGMFQYPEGWKAFRYIGNKGLVATAVIVVDVSIPRRVEGLPILKFHSRNG